ncbi:MAG: hypothetical protein HY556_10905 [Euryarchaeota archaeon]|nr:hypothetical protein [Euryarchaeota archaeon]
MERTVALLLTAILVAGCLGPTVEPENVKENAPRVRVKGTIPYDVTLATVLSAIPSNVTSVDDIVNRTLRLKASERATIFLEGRSGLGRPILSVAIVENNTAGKATIQITGSQHGNEPSGSDAALMLMELFALGAGSDVYPILSRVNLVFVPNANPDGRNLDRRGNATGIDINRDHMNLESPEGKILHEVFNRHQPAAILDLHEFGGLQGAPEQSPDNVHFEIGGPQNPLVHQEVARAAYDLETVAQNAVNEEFGPGWAGIYPPTDSSQGSDIHRNHYAMHNSASLLFETDGSLGSGDGYKTRVRIHFIATMAVIKAVAADPARFITASATAGSDQENATKAFFVYEPQSYAGQFTRLLETHGLELDVAATPMMTTALGSSASTEPVKTSFAAGSVRVWLNQSAGRSAAEMFEVSNAQDPFYRAGPKDNGLMYYRGGESPTPASS